ncbi:MAG: hypothetical protein OXI30_14850 [Chloroflexota bacterium]|nr:hypothetical protein [Chloroflexota bacterium]
MKAKAEPEHDGGAAASAYIGQHRRMTKVGRPGFRQEQSDAALGRLLNDGGSRFGRGGDAAVEGLVGELFRTRTIGAGGIQFRRM